MLSTIAKVKTHIGLSGTTYDTTLTQILTGVDSFIKKILGRNVEEADYEDEIYDGDCVFIQLKDKPLSTEDFTFEYNKGDSETPDWATVPRDDYEFYEESGAIYMNNVYSGRKIFRISYTAGSDIPEDLEMLAIRLTAKIYNKRKSEGTSNESLENLSFGWQDLLSPEDKIIIENHKLKFFV